MTTAQEAQGAKEHDIIIGVAVGVPAGIVILALLSLAVYHCTLLHKRKAAHGVQENQTQTITSSQAPLRSQPASPNSPSSSQQNRQPTSNWYSGQPPANILPWAIGIPNASTVNTTTPNPNPNPSPSPPPAPPYYHAPSYYPTGPGGVLSVEWPGIGPPMTTLQAKSDDEYFNSD